MQELNYTIKTLFIKKGSFGQKKDKEHRISLAYTLSLFYSLIH